MMLGAQRAVLVPFRFPVFGMNLRKESYIAAQAQGPFPAGVVTASHIAIKPSDLEYYWVGKMAWQSAFDSVSFIDS